MSWLRALTGTSFFTIRDFFIPEFADAGADWISVHREACIHLDRTLHLMPPMAASRGVVINPATPVETLTEVDLVHHVLVMSINPGFGGQKFIPNALNKIAALARLRAERKLDFRIEVDGGVNLRSRYCLVRGFR